MAKVRVESFTNRYLDAVIDRLTLPSDYALAEVLGITTQAVYKMRGGGAMSATTAAKIAELLEIDPLKVIAESELERATTEDGREVWRRIARKVAVIAVAAIGGTLSAPPSGQAATLHSQNFESNATAIHIVRRRRSWLDALGDWVSRLQLVMI